MSNQQSVTCGDHAAIDTDHAVAQRTQFPENELLNRYFASDLFHQISPSACHLSP